MLVSLFFRAFQFPPGIAGLIMLVSLLFAFANQDFRRIAFISMRMVFFNFADQTVTAVAVVIVGMLALVSAYKRLFRIAVLIMRVVFRQAAKQVLPCAIAGIPVRMRLCFLKAADHIASLNGIAAFSVGMSFLCGVAGFLMVMIQNLGLCANQYALLRLLNLCIAISAMNMLLHAAECILFLSNRWQD